MTRRLARNPQSGSVLRARKRFGLVRSISNLISDVLSFPFRITSSVIRGFIPSIMSLLTFRFARGGMLGFLSGPSRLFTLVMAVWLVVNPYLLSEMDSSSRQTMTYLMLGAAGIAVLTSMYGCLRSIMTCAFWLIAAFVVGSAVYKVKPSKKQPPVLVASSKNSMPEELEFYDIPSQTFESIQANVGNYMPDIGGIYNDIQNGVVSNVSSITNTVSNGVSNNLSGLMQISGLSGATGVLAAPSSISIGSGTLPDSAFFPPPAKTSGFYRIRGSRGGAVDTINNVIGGVIK